jgi:hypothetical protein
MARSLEVVRGNRGTEPHVDLNPGRELHGVQVPPAQGLAPYRDPALAHSEPANDPAPASTSTTTRRPIT